MAWFFIPAYKVLAMAATHELFPFPLGVTSFNKKTSPSDELGKKLSLKKVNCVLKVESMPKEIDYIMIMDVFSLLVE